ncbi:hypothetical protein CGLO_17268 [Colletotrichum gloeosporioides Cg-14]|uniref:Uncharacterized protein n=1 Tax=Colletotrichum gloeosporioides (strain Cg-14) TaxID=1237896 RepID=T0JU25_COLGC|nr:hypothetical protein CGLO_17268 [Colletotrichum gloeosporioides Cg-14]
MAGVEGRTNLLVRLATALTEKREYFGDNGRPGNMVGILLAGTPLNASVIYANRHHSHSVERPHERAGTNLAPVADRY